MFPFLGKLNLPTIVTSMQITRVPRSTRSDSWNYVLVDNTLVLPLNHRVFSYAFTFKFITNFCRWPSVSLRFSYLRLKYHRQWMCRRLESEIVQGQFNLVLSPHDHIPEYL